ncbi:uncharacterized protein LOC113494693 [Trichoplusia ni]|uniref:Uncharacterized protein LOC113494693 n=1 Tax=Trichoplusia ni TaxID=7111 RepID=A0A7E5VKT9_TRINI|nr:uncharacterized protein LOC113494693 [Trichoplusia ni]
MITFAELTKQVHLINDLILSDMVCEDVDTSQEAITFSKHLLATKYWFARISWANKKRYLLALLQDVKSAWALSLLLKSMWNCRPKDAVLSANEPILYSSYDQVPLDHNRTALPVLTLAQVMKSDRIWFLSLDPESQALVMSELLTVAGGPVMWEVLKRARHIYEKYRDGMLQSLQECIVVHETVEKTPTLPPSPTLPSSSASPDKVSPKRDSRKSSASSSAGPDSARPIPVISEAQRTLDASLATWNATIKSMRDSLKLEEMEMTFNDGTKRKIWKVLRPKPEVIESVDFVQQLPSSIGKRIISYLPRAQLGEYARVNKYWAYLVEEFKAELTARTKLNTDFERLHEMFLRHDTSMEMFTTHNEMQVAPASSQGASLAPSGWRQPLPSVKASEKSGGVYSLRHLISNHLSKPVVVQKPIRNMQDLNERMEIRGAADENIWKWCENVLAHAKRIKKVTKKPEAEDGVLSLGNVHFPCPLMKMSMEVPLVPPLYRDPAMSTTAKPRRNISDCTFIHSPKERIKRYSLWTRDLSSLYPVLKIPSYQSPIFPHPHGSHSHSAH